MNMNTTIKIFIALVAGALLTCLAAGVVSVYLFRSAGSAAAGLLKSNPEEVVRVGGEIAEYDLPEGFPEVFSAQLAGYEMIGYTGSDGHSHIYFFQLPAGVTVDVSNMGGELQKTFPDGAGTNQDVRVVDSQPGTIAGQEVTLVLSEGMNKDGKPFRELSAAFQGKGGQALVVFSRPTAAWDQDEVDRFLASIR
jgi:hypothetical protein